MGEYHLKSALVLMIILICFLTNGCINKTEENSSPHKTIPIYSALIKPEKPLTVMRIDDGQWNEIHLIVKNTGRLQ